MLRQHKANWQVDAATQDRNGTVAQLTPEQGVLLDGLAGRILRAGLGVPARLWLQAGHPAVFLLEQLIWVAQPALSLLVPRSLIVQTGRLLQEPAAMAALLARLEGRES